MIRTSLALAGLLVAAMPVVAAEPEVGVAAAVNPQATGTPPGAEARVIEVGLDMIRDERIATGPEGRTQMLFLDGSALTIGPSSELTLDEFVFDAETGAGKLAFSTGKGLFRFVGGKISKTAEVTFRTPTALIGVRGGIAIVEVDEAATRAQFLFGDRMTVAAGGVVREVGRAGFEVTAGPNRPPSAPAPLSRGEVAGKLVRLEGMPGSSGGARERPMDSNVVGRPIAGMGSAMAPRAAAPQAGPGPAGRGGPAPGMGGPGQGPAMGPPPPMMMQPPGIVPEASHRAPLPASPTQ